jgi:hypothetical protein
MPFLDDTYLPSFNDHIRQKSTNEVHSMCRAREMRVNPGMRMALGGVRASLVGCVFKENESPRGLVVGVGPEPCSTIRRK